MFKAVGAAYRVTEPLASRPLPIHVIKGSRFGAALGAPELLMERLGVAVWLEVGKRPASIPFAFSLLLCMLIRWRRWGADGNYLVLFSPRPNNLS